MDRPTASSQDSFFMERVVSLARQAAGEGERNGIAALIVRDGEAVAEGVNEVHLDNDPTRHAEIVAISRAGKRLQSPDLSGCTLYSSLQPCEMCLSAIRFAGIDRVVFAATKEKVAAKYFVFPKISLAEFQAAAKAPFEILGGLQEADVLTLYREGDE